MFFLLVYTFIQLRKTRNFLVCLFFIKNKPLDETFCQSSGDDPGGIQTHDFRNRNPAFYSAKLRGRIFTYLSLFFYNFKRYRQTFLYSQTFVIHVFIETFVIPLYFYWFSFFVFIIKSHHYFINHFV